MSKKKIIVIIIQFILGFFFLLAFIEQYWLRNRPNYKLLHPLNLLLDNIDGWSLTNLINTVVFLPIGVILLASSSYMLAKWKIKEKKIKKVTMEQEQSERRIVEERKIEEQRVRFERDSLEKVKKMIGVSDRIKLEMMQESLGMEKKQFLNKLYDWAAEFNFRIDGDYIVINQDTLPEFMNALDQQFAEWEQMEQKGVGKTEIPSGEKGVYCINCGKQTQSKTFCEFCGKQLPP